jgi:hypothetical protein
MHTGELSTLHEICHIQVCADNENRMIHRDLIRLMRRLLHRGDVGLEGPQHDILLRQTEFPRVSVSTRHTASKHLSHVQYEDRIDVTIDLRFKLVLGRPHIWNARGEIPRHREMRRGVA